MKKSATKLTSILLTLMLLLTLLPAPARAEEAGGVKVDELPAETALTAEAETEAAADGDAETVTITVTVDAARGTVTGGGTYAVGDTVTLKATAKDGYIFDGWYEDGIKLYLPSGTFIAERDRVIEARFKIAIKAANAEITFPVGGEHPDLTIESSEPDKYSVTLTYWYDWGSYTHLDADDTFEAGKKYAMRFVFEAKEGYAFDNAAFTVNNEPTNSYGATTQREIRVIAVTDPNATYTLTVNGGGGSGAYHEWDRVTIAAEPPADNMGFREWIGLGDLEILQVVGTYQARLSPEVTFRMPAKDVKITASYGINKVEATATGNILPKLGENMTVDPVFDLHNDDLVVNTGGSCWRYSPDGSYWYGPSELDDKTFRQGYWKYDFRMQTVDDALVSNPCTVTVNGEVWSTAGSNVATQIFADSPVYYLDAEGNVLPGLIRIKKVTATCASFPAALNMGDTLASFPDFTCTTTPDDAFVYAHGEWQKKDGEEWKSVSGPVQVGEVYRYKTYLRMSNYNSTHTLDDAVTLTVNGVEWTVDHDTRENWGLENAYVEVYSPAIEARLPALTKVEILEFNPPTTDVIFDSETKKLYKTKIPEDAIYYIISHSWYCEDGSSILTDTLEEGETYRYRVQFGLNDTENNRFPDSVDEISVTVNGSSEAYVVEKKYAMNGDKQMLRCEVLFTCTGEKPDTTPVRPTGSGTWSDPFSIYNAGELYWFAGLVNGTVEAPSNLTVEPSAACARLINDITVNPCLLACLATRNPGLVEWAPIGQTAGYSGIFEGRGKTISGIYCGPESTQVESDYVGLFSTLTSGGCIRDLTLADSYISGSAGSDRTYVGGIVGEIGENAVVKNCHFDGTVTLGDSAGVDTLGGIAAVNQGAVRNCTVKGAVGGYAKNAIGGIVGSMVQGTVIGCVNEAAVKNLVPGTSMAGDTSGGIVGTMANGTIQDCSNKGDISGNNSGGVVGMAGWGSGDGTAITRCWNEGTVEEGAGIVYWLNNENVTVKNCYNAGRVRYGIVDGYTGSGHSVTYCHNVGELTAGSNGAPIISKAETDDIEIENCYYMADSELDEIDGTYAQSGTMFSNHDLQPVCKMLNNKNEGNWVQGDHYPVLTEYVPSAFDYIAITTPPTRVNYLSGENFDPAGMVVTAYYNDGTSRPVTDYTVTNGNNLSSSDTSVNILYQEEGVTQIVQQAITVEKRTRRLTVVGASGGGEFEVGRPVSASVGYVSTGKVFKKWTADGIDLSELTFTVGSATTSEITFLMPAKDFTLTAVIEDVLYDVTVVNGTLENGATSGKFKMGSYVTVFPDRPAEGMKFTGWTSRPTVRFINDSVFLMPSQGVILTATYEEAYLTVDGTVTVTGTAGREEATVDIWVEYLELAEGLDPDSGAMLVVAQYNNEGRLLATQTNSVKMDAHYRTFPFSGHKDDYVYGIFLVNAKNCKPLCEAVYLWGGGD